MAESVKAQTTVSRPFLAFLLLPFFVSAGTGSSQTASAPTRPEPSSDVPSSTIPVLPGIDVLEEQQFSSLRGKRIGLLTHPAGVNRFGMSSIDVIRRDPRNNLVALFGPEHGIYGNEKADQPIDDQIDPRTNLPVYSLYGRYRKPTATMLQTIDALVIDLQDIGVRSYTYVSCMRYAIEASFENNVEVIILDRPNPLGGQKVNGPPLDKEWMSYVGAFQVPYVHGLTIGELARVSVSIPGVLKISEQDRLRGRITVVPMRGWNRSMTWPETGLRWVPTSPNIPTYEAVVGYAMTGLGAQLGGFRHGVGGNFPFRILTFRNQPLDKIERALGKRPIPGLAFRRRTFTNTQGNQGIGLYIDVVDWSAWRPTELSFWMMQITCELNASNPFAAAKNSRANLFNKHVGSTTWWQSLVQRGATVDVSTFVLSWEYQAKTFQEKSRAFYLYP
jgi:uncharacterized protein YbbC (DUF1343 family)